MIIDEVLGGFAASDAAKNERETQRKNQAAWDAYRRQVLDEFYKSRGSQGNAFLPLYFGSGDDSFERRLATDYKDLYSALPEINPQSYVETAARYQPIVDASRGTLEDAFNGNMTNTRLGYLKPVQQARTNLAQSRREAIFEGLRQRINALNADSARKGFSGTGSFAQKRLLGATIGARQAAAGEVGGAKLQNEMDERGVLDSGMNTRLALLDQPFKQAGSNMLFMRMPGEAAAGAFSDRLAPANFFRIGTAMPNLPAPLPEHSVPTDSQIWLQTGANIAHNIGQAAASLYGGGMMGGGGGGFGGFSGSGPSAGGFSGGGAAGGWMAMPNYGYA